MTIFLGLIIIAAAMGLAIACYGMFVDDNGPWMGLGIGVIAVTCVISLVGLGLALIIGIDFGPQLVEGSCYRAVGHDTVMPITTGKVTTIVPMHGVDLIEIHCP